MTTSRFRKTLLRARLRIFGCCQKLGINITRNDFYSPIPDTNQLKDQIWQRRSELVGLDFNESAQLQLLSEFSSRYRNEYDRFPVKKTPNPCEFYLSNGRFQFVDACICYCMIRHNKPGRIIEIGSGNSTLLLAKALLKNQAETGTLGMLTSVDPYPRDFLKKGFLGFSDLFISRMEDMDLKFFDRLGQNDVLFIDSTHVLKTGGDVKCLYLDVLPRLRKGVLIHIHDIFLPFDYPKELILKGLMFWNEQYLLQALLTYTIAFEIIWAGNYMRSKCIDSLRSAFTSFDPTKVRTASFWIKKRF